MHQMVRFAPTKQKCSQKTHYEENITGNSELPRSLAPLADVSPTGRGSMACPSPTPHDPTKANRGRIGAWLDCFGVTVKYSDDDF